MASAAAGHEEKKDYIIEHLLYGPDLHTPFGHIHLPHIELFGYDISITRHVVMMWVASLFLITVFLISTRRRGLVPKGFANAAEAMDEHLAHCGVTNVDAHRQWLRPHIGLNVKGLSFAAERQRVNAG